MAAVLFSISSAMMSSSGSGPSEISEKLDNLITKNRNHRQATMGPA